MKHLAAVALVFSLVLTIGCNSAKQGSVAALPNPGAGNIDGIVTTGGAPLPGVTVTLTSGKQTLRTVVTDANGLYLFSRVAPGNYVIVYELASMSRASRHVRLSTDGIRIPMEMRLSGVAEAITVTAEAPANQPGTFTLGTAAPAPYVPRSREKAVAGGVMAGSPAYIDASPVPEPVGDAQYATHQDHAFIETKTEPMTTFAIDVDRASYSNVRRFLNANQMPPAGAVRIEEMINYFTYSYAPPSGPHPFSISSEVASAPWNPRNRLLRVGIQGRELDEWKMAPNNLVFLIDVSGSMQPPERLPLLKSAFRVLVDRLRAEDKVSIVVYAGAAGLVLPPTSGADKRTILAALDGLNAGGSTAGGAGIELAYRTARESFLANGNNRVILATDGDFNVGISSNVDLEQLIELRRQDGVFLTTIGVGTDNYHDARMELLADKGNGTYYYLDNAREAEKVFREELTGTLVTIAKDVKIQLEFNPAVVASYRQIGYENRALQNKDFADDTKDAGDLGAGHSVTALYEITPVAAGATGHVATVRLRYKEPKGATSQLITDTINDQGRSIYQASADLQWAAAIAEFGMLLRNSPHKGMSSYADVLTLARAARGTDLAGHRDELIRMVETSRSLGGEAPVAIAGQ